MSNEFERHEVDSIYVAKEGRFVVSLIVSYAVDEAELELLIDEFGGDDEDPMRAAASAALALTTDGGRRSTHWHVFDRKTGQGRFFEQGDL